MVKLTATASGSTAALSASPRRPPSSCDYGLVQPSMEDFPHGGLPPPAATTHQSGFNGGFFPLHGGPLLQLRLRISPAINGGFPPALQVASSARQAAHMTPQPRNGSLSPTTFEAHALHMISLLSWPKMPSCPVERCPWPYQCCPTNAALPTLPELHHLPCPLGQDALAVPPTLPPWTRCLTRLATRN